MKGQGTFRRQAFTSAAVLPLMVQVSKVTVPSSMKTPPPYIRRRKSQFIEAMDNRQRRFKRHTRLTFCARMRVEQEMSEKVHPSGRWMNCLGRFKRRALTVSAVLPLMVQASKVTVPPWMETPPPYNPEKEMSIHRGDG